MKFSDQTKKKATELYKLMCDSEQISNWEKEEARSNNQNVWTLPVHNYYYALARSMDIDFSGGGWQGVVSWLGDIRWGDREMRP